MALLVALLTSAAQASPAVSSDYVPIHRFLELVRTDEAARKDAGAEVSEGWRHSYTPILLELIRSVPRSRNAGELWQIIERNTGQKFGRDLDAAFQWVWSRDYEPHPDYALFKAVHYQNADRDFLSYFDDYTENARVRLDEIRWGGVVRDGIPPLDRPAMISAERARYLSKSNTVFGIEINGDARAYPKRILAWHEMFKDSVGGVSIVGVYCTLCGTLIIYETEHEGVHHELGTSGFLYRSNKLMYDHATESLWNTLEGTPVVGPLAGKGIELTPLHVVTTTWGQWKRRNPHTTVLSKDTGHARDYGEGVAYRDYFATDRLMFSTPFKDDRLRNKDEVFALRFGLPSEKPRAYSTRYLKRRKIQQGRYGDLDYVLIADPSGAIRAYESRGREFTLDRNAVLDTDGGNWQMQEHALVSENGYELPRLPSHRAFWFGWLAAFPDTELIK